MLEQVREIGRVLFRIYILGRGEDEFGKCMKRLWP